MSPRIALVLLPGMDGSGELFAAFVAALGDAVTPLVLSYPGDQTLDYAGLAEFARAYLPVDQPFVLLGESFSGPVAIALAGSRPPGLAGLILSCSFARNPVPLFAPLKRCLGALPVSGKLTSLLAPLLLGAHSTPAVRQAVCAALQPVAPAVIRARMRAVLEVDVSARMRNVGVPILYLQALQDRVVSSASARHLATLDPHMQLVRLRGPHQLLQAMPSEAALAVMRFIGTLMLPSQGQFP